jgi:glyoxalase family protein
MRPINGIHHITLITGDAPGNVDFYARVMGLRLVKKTVNQDDPSVYHLYYADENGSPGANITFIEDPGAARGRAGAGMVSSIIHRVASEAALHFWSERLRNEGVELAHQPSRLAFADPEGMRHELAIIPADDEPLIARSTEVPAEYALQGFEAVRARVADVIPSEAWLRDVLALTELTDHDWEARGVERGARILFEETSERGVPGAGTVHDIAWSIYRAEQGEWEQRVSEAGGHPTPIVDRSYFESVYFREPGGILYELATLDSAAFTVDEPFETMGEMLSLPPQYESLREKLERSLTPLPDIRQWRPAPVTSE